MPAINQNKNSCKSSFFAEQKTQVSFEYAMIKKIGLVGCFLLSICFKMEAQLLHLTLRGETTLFFSLTQVPQTFNSFIDCNEALKSAHLALYKQGYLTASIDSLRWDDTSASAFVTIGKKFTWATLKNKNIPSSLLTQAQFDEKEYFNKPVEIKKLIPVFEKVIRSVEDNGYPFASVFLDSVEIQSNQVNALLTLDKGPLIHIDTIIVNEDANISKQYLMQYLGLKQGMLYNESTIRDISKRIRELPFLQEAAPWRIEFNVAETKLSLYVKTKSANRADVLIGLLPNNAERAGKFLLTGDVKLAFINALGYGENLTINWQNLQYQSPRYDIDFQLPYLLHTPIGVTGKFNFYKKDTTFKNVNGELGLIYQFSANQQLKLYYELASSRVLNINIPLLIATRRLPELGDVTCRSFGLETQRSHVDYKPNPRKGYRFNLNASIAFRNILKNTTVESTLDPVSNMPFSYLYDSLQTTSFKYTIKGQGSYFIPLAKRLVVASTCHAAITYSSHPLYKNELFQIGGYRLLRGFDEGSLYVNAYSVLSIEPRYLLSLNSYFFMFGDLGVIHANYHTINKTEIPYSVGLGMTFETKAGLFNISYALGAKQHESFQFKSSKIHFGYVNYF